MSKGERPNQLRTREQKRSQFAGTAVAKRRKLIPLVAITLIGAGAFWIGSRISEQPAATRVNAGNSDRAPQSGDGATSNADGIAVPVSALTSVTGQFAAPQR